LLELLTQPESWIALLTLTVLEIVLGIDNIVFISILAGKLPKEQQNKARKLGLGLALIARIILLLSITWVMGLTKPLFAVWGHSVSGRDLILLIGGLFLVAKATREIHVKLEGEEQHGNVKVKAAFGAILIQIMLLDLVFSLDSVITAVGMADEVAIMIAAVIIAIGFMFVFAGAIGEFVERHPTVKMLALSFLVLIGVNLIAEGFGQHIPKGYTYFAMAFSVAVEMLNLRMKNKSAPVKLRNPDFLNE